MTDIIDAIHFGGLIVIAVASLLGVVFLRWVFACDCQDDDGDDDDGEFSGPILSL